MIKPEDIVELVRICDKYGIKTLHNTEGKLNINTDDSLIRTTPKLTKEQIVCLP